MRGHIKPPPTTKVACIMAITSYDCRLRYDMHTFQLNGTWERETKQASQRLLTRYWLAPIRLMTFGTPYRSQVPTFLYLLPAHTPSRYHSQCYPPAASIVPSSETHLGEEASNAIMPPALARLPVQVFGTTLEEGAEPARWVQRLTSLLCWR